MTALTSHVRAHPAGQFYPKEWDMNAIHYYFAGSVPTGNPRDRIHDGAQEWNALPPLLHFYKEGTHEPDPFHNCPQTPNVIRMSGGLPPYVYAETVKCSSVYINSFQMRFNDDVDWWFQTDAPPAGQVDIWGISAHEFGHAGGFRGDHFNEADPDTCEPGVPRHTMCAGTLYQGEVWQRTLELHDRETFDNAYP